MSHTQTYAGERLVIKRTLSAPLARVWTAFSDPVEMKLWGAPEGMRVASFDCDLRVGGSYRLVMEKIDDGEKHIAKGTYRAIVPEARIAYTWTWEEDTPAEERETFVTWEFQAAGSKTELTLTHEGLASVESRDGHNGGWSQMFDKFERYLAG